MDTRDNNLTAAVRIRRNHWHTSRECFQSGIGKRVVAGREDIEVARPIAHLWVAPTAKETYLCCQSTLVDTRLPALQICVVTNHEETYLGTLAQQCWQDLQHAVKSFAIVARA
jgi:hypothetical protein